jgi:hypothetical protein
VVNTAGRVVTSSDVRWVTGDLIRGLPVGRWWAGERVHHPEWDYFACPGLPLGVIATRPA